MSGYVFTFTKQPHEKKEYKTPVPKIAEKTGWEPTGKFRPACHAPIYQRLIENENGQYYQLGHPDFKTGKCNYLTNSFSDLLTQQQLDELNRPRPTAEQVENKKRYQK